MFRSSVLSAIERAHRYLAKCPPAITGNGGHNATFHVAAALVHGFGLDSARRAAHTMPRGYMLGKGRGSLMPLSTRPHAPLPVPEVIEPVNATELFLGGFRCSEQDIAKASLIPVDGDWRYDAALLVEALYHPNEDVNFVTEYELSTDEEGRLKAKPSGRGITLLRDQLVARFNHYGTDSSDGGAWRRMNPLNGHGVCDANVTAFRFALLESDVLPVDLNWHCLRVYPCQFRPFWQ